MTAPKARPAAKQDAVPADDAPPPYYIATEALFIGGNQFARAHNAGDRVPVDHVDRYGWADQVRPPDGYQPRNEPETDGGQATTEGKGDA